MSFTLYVVFHGLVALLPNEADGRRHVIMPDLYTEYKEQEDHCNRHEAWLTVAKGYCGFAKCPAIGPMQKASIDLSLPPVADPAVEDSELIYVWPLSSDLGREVSEEADLAAKLTLEAGSLKTCHVQELVDTDSQAFSPEFTLWYPFGSPKINRSAVVAESALWTRSVNLESLSVEVSHPEATLEVQPVPCGDVGDCIVLWIFNPGVNNGEWSCGQNVKFIAKHFREYLPLFDLPAAKYPVVPTFPSKVTEYPMGCSELPEGAEPPHHVSDFPGLWSRLFPFGAYRLLAPSQPAACPIVQ